ncbi:hypothetical protein [Kitasatospora sp. NPDC056531]|uniref:hypothetical protein n=1 Tax=Kitasatospora sp. NPDC056531 TaxID=3345856 RepID=UPI003674BCA7
MLTTHRVLFLKDGKPPVPVPFTAVTDATVTRTGLNGDALTVVVLTGSHRFEDGAYGAGWKLLNTTSRTGACAAHLSSGTIQ